MSDVDSYGTPRQARSSATATRIKPSKRIKTRRKMELGKVVGRLSSSEQLRVVKICLENGFEVPGFPTTMDDMMKKAAEIADCTRHNIADIKKRITSQAKELEALKQIQRNSWKHLEIAPSHKYQVFPNSFDMSKTESPLEPCSSLNSNALLNRYRRCSTQTVSRVFIPSSALSFRDRESGDHHISDDVCRLCFLENKAEDNERTRYDARIKREEEGTIIAEHKATILSTASTFSGSESSSLDIQHTDGPGFFDSHGNWIRLPSSGCHYQLAEHTQALSGSTRTSWLSRPGVVDVDWGSWYAMETTDVMHSNGDHPQNSMFLQSYQGCSHLNY